MAARALKAFVKSRFPAGVELYKHVFQLYSERKPMQAVFTGIHHSNTWGDAESVSGPGSTRAQTAVIRDRLPALVKEIKARSLLDAPCGDFNWMKETGLDIDLYIGADVVPDLITRNQQAYSSPTRSFVQLDITQDAVPEVDLILCRDCLFHFSEKAVFAALRNFKASKSKYLLTTTYPDTEKNINIVTGGWRPLNLEAAPFNLPRPVTLLDEKWMEENGENSGKHLGLWKLDDIRVA